MINVFKVGGEWKSGDFAYTVKNVSPADSLELIKDGYFLTLEEAKAVKPAPKKSTKKVVKEDDDKGSDS